MKMVEHQGRTLRYLALEPDGYRVDRRYPMVVLLHGFSSQMADLAGLCPAIDPEGYVYICPNAPLPLQIGSGMQGYAWTARDATGVSDFDTPQKMLTVLLEEAMERYHVEHGQVILGGFSQGGMMTYQYGLTQPDIFRGLVVLSGNLTDPNGQRARLPSSRTQRIFIAHGVGDTMIPIDDARDSVGFLREEGYKPDYREYSMGHQINQEVLEDLVPWMHEVVSPFRSRPVTGEADVIDQPVDEQEQDPWLR